MWELVRTIFSLNIILLSDTLERGLCCRFALRWAECSFACLGYIATSLHAGDRASCAVVAVQHRAAKCFGWDGFMHLRGAPRKHGNCRFSILQIPLLCKLRQIAIGKSYGKSGGGPFGRVDNLGSHPSGMWDKLKRAGQYLINWMFFLLILGGTDPSKCNAQAERCTGEVNRAARWVGNIANIQCCRYSVPIPNWPAPRS